MAKLEAVKKSTRKWSSIGEIKIDEKALHRVGKIMVEEITGAALRELTRKKSFDPSAPNPREVASSIRYRVAKNEVEIICDWPESMGEAKEGGKIKGVSTKEDIKEKRRKEAEEREKKRKEAEVARREKTKQKMAERLAKLRGEEIESAEEKEKEKKKVVPYLDRIKERKDKAEKKRKERVLAKMKPDGMWVHPSSKKYSFFEAGIKKGKERAMKIIAESMVKRIASSQMI